MKESTVTTDEGVRRFERETDADGTTTMRVKDENGDVKFEKKTKRENDGAVKIEKERPDGTKTSTRAKPDG